MKKIYLIKTLLLLCALVAGSGSVWAADETITISISSFTDLPTGTASYSTYNWSEGGVSGKATIYANQNSESLQFNASNYLFYSTSAIPGTIKSVKLTTASGTNRTYVVYGSTSAYTGSGTSYGTQIGSQTVTTSGTTFTVSSGEYTYFTIVKTGSGAGYLSSVEVTYTPGSAPVDPSVDTCVTIEDSGITSTNFSLSDAAVNLSATLTASENTIEGATVTWASEDESVATIDENTGVVTLIGIGTTTITAYYAGVENTYKPSTATYSLTVFYNDPNATELWTESFSTYSSGVKPTNDSYNYVCVDGGSETKIYNESNAGGTTPELLVGKNGGSFSATIPLNNIEGDLRLTYRTNKKTLLVSNNFEEGYVLSETAGEHTVTISGVTHNMTEITITFAAGGNDNVRLDDIHLEGSEYKPAVVAPTFSVPGGTYYTAQSVELSCTTEGATIYYTTDGSDPTSESTVYSGPISVSSTTRISAIAIKGSDVSEIAVATYTITQKDDVIFDIDNQELAFGSTFTLEADDDYLTDGEVTLSSDNDVVTIDGLTITAAAVGTATITVNAAEGPTCNAGSTTFTVTVTAPEGLTTAQTAIPAAILFNETFNNCEGDGGRDGIFDSNVGTGSTANFLDEEWAGIGTNGNNAAYQCIKLGTSDKYGTAKTRNIALTGKGTLTFSAAGWYIDVNTVTVSATGATLSGDTEVTLDNQVWSNYTVDITDATGSVAITFSMKRGFLDDVKVVSEASEAPAITATLNKKGYATFCSKYPLDFSDYETADYSAWQITEIDFDKITFEQITGSVKGGTGIFLKGTADKTITLTSADSETVLSDNKLVGTLAPTYVGADEYYGLSGNNFVKINAGTVPAGKAILNIEPEAEPGARLTFIFADATGISEVEHGTLNADETVYDLQGRRVVKAQKGLYIVNGKKVIMK